MADRQKFCIGIMSLLLLLSAGYLGYYLFLHSDHSLITKPNHIRFYIFFGQHFLALFMLFTLLFTQNDEHDSVIKWMFKLSALVMMTFIGGEVFVVARGGRVFGGRVMGDTTGFHQDITEFQLNEITLYFQIMTDFALFFIVSAIAMIVLRCRDIDTQQRYEFMIDNLKSQQFMDEPNAGQKKGCAICLTDLQAQRVLKLPCEHVFHKQCLVNWLKRSTVCPMCRNDIEESLSPTSPQRYPPARSQPLLLPPPQSVLSNPPQSNPLIQPRQVISLNQRNNRSQLSRNQNQRSGRYLIFEHQQRINVNSENQRVSGRERLPIVGNGIEMERQRKADQQQVRMMRIEREEILKDRTRQMRPGAVTQRQNQTQIPTIDYRPVSSPHLQYPQPPKSLTIEPQPPKLPSPVLSNPHSFPNNKSAYTNPNQLNQHIRTINYTGQNNQKDPTPMQRVDQQRI